MPASVVRTPEQEEMWNKAKKIAAGAGQSNNYAYVMGVYKKMGGLKKNSAEWDDTVEKLAAGYLSKLIGTNVAKQGKKVTKLTKELAEKADAMKAETVTRRGFLGLGERKPRPKYSTTDIKNATNDVQQRLNAAKAAKKEAEKATYKTRRNTLIVGGLTGAGAYTAKKQIDNYGQQNYKAAEQNNAGMDKEAAVKDLAKKIINGVQDAATLKSYRALRKDFKTLKHGGKPGQFSAPEFDTASSARDAATFYKGKVDKADRILNKYVPNENNIYEVSEKVTRRSQPIHRTVDIREGKRVVDQREVPGFRNPQFTRSRSNRARNVENAKDYYSKAYDASNAIHDKAYNEALRKKDIALSKSLGLYGGAAGAVGAGIYTARKKKQADK